MNEKKPASKNVKRDPSLHAHHRQRMKDKFMKYGLDVFSEHEIMELLLFYVLPHVDTNEIAHQLINKGGSFIGAFQLSYEEMKTVSGVKDQCATFLKLIPELSRYFAVKDAEITAQPSMTYADIANLCVASFVGRNTETLIAYYFDSQMHYCGSSVIGEGGFHSVSTNYTKIIDEMKSKNVANCVLAHNHPSVSMVPSSDDLDSTIRLQKLLAQFNLTLVEHFVISGPTYLGILKCNEETKQFYSL